MDKKAVQKRLCIKPREFPDEALKFVVAFEEGIHEKASYDMQNKLLQVEVKSDQVSRCVISNRGEICFRREAPNFTHKHISECKASQKRFNKCGIRGHFA